MPKLERDLKEFELGKMGRRISMVIIRAKVKEIAKYCGITNSMGGPSLLHEAQWVVSLPENNKTSLPLSTLPL